MTFEELPLYESVYEVYRTVGNPRSDTWLRPPMCEELYRMIRERWGMHEHFTPEQVFRVWGTFGKSSTVEVDLKKAELIVLVARAHGRRCFYCGRGRGDCSNEVALDRIVPGARGGRYTVENCIIACSFHNQQRSDRTIEEYISQETI